MRFENMRMYQAAERLVAAVDPLVARTRVRAPRQADHLERSADSVFFNTAEGIAAYRPKVKINAYEIARKEANEVRAVLRRLVIKRALSHADIQQAYDLASACIAMLTNAIKSVAGRTEESPSGNEPSPPPPAARAPPPPHHKRRGPNPPSPESPSPLPQPEPENQRGAGSGRGSKTRGSGSGQGLGNSGCTAGWGRWGITAT